MNTRKFLKEVNRMLDAAHMPILETNYGKHIKIRVQTPFGPRQLVTSLSASDQYALKQVERNIRQLKERGMTR